MGDSIQEIKNTLIYNTTFILKYSERASNQLINDGKSMLKTNFY